VIPARDNRRRTSAFSAGFCDKSVASLLLCPKTWRSAPYASN